MRCCCRRSGPRLPVPASGLHAEGVPTMMCGRAGPAHARRFGCRSSRLRLIWTLRKLSHGISPASVVAHSAGPMSQPGSFEAQFSIRWADLDANRHVRNTIFSEFATHTRFRLLEANGFPQARFESLHFGPVMFREEIRYRRELVFGDEATVSVIAAGLSDDGSQWRVHQEVTRADGKQAAVLRIDGAWIDLDSRRLIAPPSDLLDLLRSLPRTEDFEVLRSVVRSAADTPA